MTHSSPPSIYLLDGSVARTGALICARNIARSLAGEARVVLIIPDGNTLPPEDVAEFAAVLHLPVHPLRRSFRAIALYLPYLFVAGIRLALILRRDRANVLLVNDFYLMQGVLCRLFGFRGRILTWVRINPAAFGRVSGIWIRLAAASSDRLIAVSKYIQTLLPEGLASDLLYDAVDTKPAEPAPANRPGEPTFVYVGNYIPGKGQDIALEAMAHLVQAIPSARLEFYGGDMGLQRNRDFRRFLMERARSLGLADSVHFGDFIQDPRTVLCDKLAALNLSRSESFSMTTLEASAFGLPVIASRCGGPEEILEDGKTGFLVPLDTPKACAEAMIRLCQDPQLARAMGEQGRERAISLFSLQVFQAKLRSIILSS